MKAEEILKKLSLKEKIALCSGEDFWHTKDLSQYGLPAMMMCDGPHGLRCQKGETDMLGVNKSAPATCFPTAALTACSWDEDLIGQVGKAIALEARAMDVGMILGPGANIKRDPLCGRNFEYFSEDPYLSGKLAAAFIQGAQETGVATSLKHFALNNQEYKRFNGNSQADWRTMREIFLAPFEIAVKEGKPAAVMCAYNKLNGVHCSDSKGLLTNVLRRQWGFDGLVVTDWGAMNDRIAAMKAGCDLSMPGGSDYMEKELEETVRDGRLQEADIDQCVLRVLRLMEKARAALAGGSTCDTDTNHALAGKAAAESAVLLKNEDAILPLREDAKIALIGTMAEKPRYQGAGSSHINPIKLVSAKEAMPQAVYAPGCMENGNTDENLLHEAVRIAKKADTAVVFAGLTDAYESEGFDREDLQMPQGHVRMIEAVAQANPNTVVVLCCGSVVECPWADRVKGILYLGLAGQACGEAAKDVLYGTVNPSGKLAQTWPYVYEDTPTAGYYRHCKDPQYREGIYVGYRYFDKANVPVRWPFGYGLSYTKFSYSDLVVKDSQVTFSVKNTGDRTGAEVAQLYIAAPQDGLHRPVKELKGFCKVFLVPGEEKRVSIKLNDRSFALWNGKWTVPGGTYQVFICSDSQTVQLAGSIRKEGLCISAPAWQSGSWYESPMGSPTQAQWEALYGKQKDPKSHRKGTFTMDHTLAEMQEHSSLMRAMGWGMRQVFTIHSGGKKAKDSPELRMLIASSFDAPLRSLQLNGGIKGGLMKGLRCMANGRVGRGILVMLGKEKEKCK